MYESSRNNKELSQEEKLELAHLLHQDLNIPNIELISSNINMDQKVLCPHCNRTDIYGHGIYKGRKLYKCKVWKKTFNDFTGTAIS